MRNVWQYYAEAPELPADAPQRDRRESVQWSLTPLHIPLINLPRPRKYHAWVSVDSTWNPSSTANVTVISPRFCEVYTLFFRVEGEESNLELILR